MRSKAMIESCIAMHSLDVQIVEEEGRLYIECKKEFRLLEEAEIARKMLAVNFGHFSEVAREVSIKDAGADRYIDLWEFSKLSDRKAKTTSPLEPVSLYTSGTS
jgi:hypothetical protein